MSLHSDTAGMMAGSLNATQFCRKCGKALCASSATTGTEPRATKSKSKVRTPFKVAGVLLILFLIGLVVAARAKMQPSFTQHDVLRTEFDIRSKYESEGFTAEQVSMIKDSDRRLSGFVKAKKSAGLIKLEFTNYCVADMDADSGKYIWECK